MKLTYINKKGQTLVEITLAIAVSVIIITGVMALTTDFLRSAQEFLRRSEAVKFANAGTEAAIYYKNTTDFSSIQTGNYRINAEGTGLTYSNADAWVPITSVTSGLTYYRKIYLEKTADNVNLNVLSEVQWPDDPDNNPTKNKKVVIVNTLTNWSK